MIVMSLSGGMGNQMFQCAAAASLAIDKGTDFILDVSLLNNRTEKAHFTYRNFALESFGLEKHVSKNPYTNILPVPHDNIRKRFMRKIRSLEVWYEQGLSYDPDIQNLTPPIYLHGYFQSEKYFIHNKSDIKQLFTLDKRLSNAFYQNREIISRSNTLGIHVRRGDFVSDAHINEVHGALSIDYYKNAIDEINQQSPPENIYVFSDDYNWVQKEFIPQIGKNIEISPGNSAIEDFELMRACSKFIVANSTFSWWAAWLGESENSNVIAPKKWFSSETKNSTDIVPDHWIRL